MPNFSFFGEMKLVVDTSMRPKRGHDTKQARQSVCPGQEMLDSECWFALEQPNKEKGSLTVLHIFFLLFAPLARVFYKWGLREEQLYIPRGGKVPQNQVAASD